MLCKHFIRIKYLHKKKKTITLVIKSFTEFFIKHGQRVYIISEVMRSITTL